MSSRENHLVRTDGQSSSITDSSASSRSSSRSSGAQTNLKVDERITQIAEPMVNEFKADILAELQEKLKESNLATAVISECSSAIINRVDDVKAEETKKLVAAITQVNKQAQEKYSGKIICKKAKSDLNDAVKKTTKEIFSTDWQDTAREITENDTEEVEEVLWGELGTQLQGVYRHYRNTGAELKLNEQTSIDVADDRLQSLLLQVHVNNLQRVQFLSGSTQQFLKEEMKRREQELKMQVELEVKTLRRELAQIKQNAELQNGSTASSQCVIL